MILSLITPVLGSLTVTYSDDTIILDFASKFFVSLQSFLSIINFYYAHNVNSIIVTVFVHLLYYDYEQINSKPDLRMIKLHGTVAATSIGVQSSSKV